MLTLRLVDDPGVPLARSDSSCEVWQDAQGAVCASGGRRGAEYWIDVPDVGLYTFRLDHTEVVCRVRSGVSAERASDVFRRVALPLGVQWRGVEVLHASAVLGSSGAIALCGVSGTGKSSLAYALTSLGYRSYADDALAFVVSDEGVRSELLPFRLMLREPAAAFFHLQPGVLAADDSNLPRDTRLAAVCLLERASASPRTLLQRIHPSEAFTEVLKHGYYFTLADERRRRSMVSSYLELVARVPVVRVRFRAELPRLPELAREVSEAVRAAI